MNLKYTFEDYLKDKFATDYRGDKHDIGDAFNDYEWGNEELIKHGDEFGAKLVESILKDFQDDVAGKAESYTAIIDLLKAKYLK